MAGVLLAALAAATAAVAPCREFENDRADFMHDVRGVQTQPTGAQDMHTPLMEPLPTSPTTMKVTVGNPPHPMVGSADPDEVHYITHIYVVQQDNIVVAMQHYLPGDEPELIFSVPKGVTQLTPLALCNRHGLFQGAPRSVSKTGSGGIHCAMTHCHNTKEVDGKCPSLETLKGDALLKQRHWHNQTTAFGPEIPGVAVKPMAGWDAYSVYVVLHESVEAPKNAPYDPEVGHVEVAWVETEDGEILGAGLYQPRDDFVFKMPRPLASDHNGSKTLNVVPFAFHTVHGLFAGTPKLVHTVEGAAPPLPSKCAKCLLRSCPHAKACMAELEGDAQLDIFSGSAHKGPQTEMTGLCHSTTPQQTLPWNEGGFPNPDEGFPSTTSRSPAEPEKRLCMVGLDVAGMPGLRVSWYTASTDGADGFHMQVASSLQVDGSELPERWVAVVLPLPGGEGYVGVRFVQNKEGERLETIAVNAAGEARVVPAAESAAELQKVEMSSPTFTNVRTEVTISFTMAPSVMEAGVMQLHVRRGLYPTLEGEAPTFATTLEVLGAKLEVQKGQASLTETPKLPIVQCAEGQTESKLKTDFVSGYRCKVDTPDMLGSAVHFTYSPDTQLLQIALHTMKTKGWAALGLTKYPETGPVQMVPSIALVLHAENTAGKDKLEWRTILNKTVGGFVPAVAFEADYVTRQAFSRNNGDTLLEAELKLERGTRFGVIVAHNPKERQLQQHSRDDRAALKLDVMPVMRNHVVPPTPRPTAQPPRFTPEPLPTVQLPDWWPCERSTLPTHMCMKVLGDDAPHMHDVQIHWFYNLFNKRAYFYIISENDGWLAVGFPKVRHMMAPADAIIFAKTDDRSALRSVTDKTKSVDFYSIMTKSSEGIVIDHSVRERMSLDDVDGEELEGYTHLAFSIQVTNQRDLEDFGLNIARSMDSHALGAHTPDNSIALTLDLTKSSLAFSDWKIKSLRRRHAACMIAGFGFLLPAATLAYFFGDLLGAGEKAFYAYIILSVAAWGCIVYGFSIASREFRYNHERDLGDHNVAGYFLFVGAAVVNPLLGASSYLVKRSGDKGDLSVVTAMHEVFSACLIFGALFQAITGFEKLRNALNDKSKTTTVLQVFLFLAVALFSMILGVFLWMRRRSQAVPPPSVPPTSSSPPRARGRDSEMQ